MIYPTLTHQEVKYLDSLRFNYDNVFQLRETLLPEGSCCIYAKNQGNGTVLSARHKVVQYNNFTVWHDWDELSSIATVVLNHADTALTDWKNQIERIRQQENMLRQPSVLIIRRMEDIFRLANVFRTEYKINLDIRSYRVVDYYIQK